MEGGSVRNAMRLLDAAQVPLNALANPTPATHAILTQLKAGETVCQADRLFKTL